MIRPLITNFASGELDPRLEGRIDLPMTQGGARELTNFFPSRLGGAFKRGGLQYKLDAPIPSKKCRLIPWSLNGTTDILIALYDGAIKFIDVSGGSDPSYMTLSGGGDLTITSFDPANPIAVYAESDIPEVNYAQNGNEITLVHGSYPALQIKISAVDTVAHTMALSYGVPVFFSNIAFNSPASVNDDGVEIQAGDLSEALDIYNGQGDVVCDSTSFVYVNGIRHELTKINLVITPSASKLTLSGMSDILPDATTHSEAFQFPVSFWRGNPADASMYNYVGGTSPDIAHSSTGAMIFSALLAYFGSDSPFQVCVYSGGFPSQSTPISIFGTFGRHPVTNASVHLCRVYNSPQSFSLILTYSAYGTYPGGTLTLTNIGTLVRASIMIGGSHLISGAKTTGSAIFDSLAPWMKRGESYPCDPSMILNGSTLTTATKELVGGKEVINFTGYLVTPANPSGMLTITRESSGLLGQAGVIITPFYRMGEHPSLVCYHQGRLVLGGNGNNIFVSKPNDHSNFSYFEDIEFDMTTLKSQSEWFDPLVPETRTDIDKTQQVGAGSAMRLEIATDENEDLKWFLSIGDLVVGTATTEWVIPAAVNAMNPSAIQTSRNGSAALQAKFVGKSIVFASPTAQAVISYTPGSKEVNSSISEHAAHMFTGKIVAFDFRQSPAQEMYFVLDSGIVLRLLMSGDVPQWSRMSTRSGDVIEGVAIVAASDEDAVYFTTRRVINGGTYRFIERLVSTPDLAFADRNHLDCSQYVASTTNPWTNIVRFSTDVVNVVFRKTGVETRGTMVATGSPTTYTDSVLGAGTTIPTGAEAWVGYAYTSRIETFRIDTQDTEGLEKGGSSLHLRLFRSGVFKVMRGYDPLDAGYDVPLPDGQVYPYSGPKRVDLDAPDLVDQSVILQSDDDQAVNILVIAPAYSVAVTP